MLREAGNLTSFEIIQGLRSLKSFVNSSNFVHSIYVYNSQRDYIFSTVDSGPDLSSGTKHFRDYGALPLLLGEQPESWMTPVHRTIDRPGGTEEVYSFVIHEYSRVGPKTVSSSILVNISSPRMQLLLAELLSDSDIAVIKENGHAVFNPDKLSGDAPEHTAFIDAINHSGSESGYIIDNIENRPYVCFYTKAPEHGWIFIKTAPYDEALRGLSELRAKNFIILAVIAASGLIFLTVLLIRLYFPFYKLMDSFSKIPKAYHFFTGEKTISAMAKEASGHVEHYTNMLKSEFLRGMILNPTASRENLEENMQLYQIRLDLGKPIYLIIAGGSDLEACYNILASSAPESRLEGFRVNMNSVFLFQTDDNPCPREVCKALCLRLNILCAYSLPITDIKGLRRGYERMSEVLKLHFFFRDTLPLSEDILLKLSKENVYPNEMEANLLRVLRSGNVEKAKEQFKLIVEFARGYRYNVVIFIFKRLYLSLADMVYSISSDEDMNRLDIFAETFDSFFSNINSVDELTACFQQMFEIAAGRILYNKRTKTLRLVERVKRYIDKNYSDPLLSLQSISDELDITPDYLGRLFRSCGDLSIPEYITNVRLNHAKTMLHNCDLKITDIAANVGIDNAKYFSTLFKKECKMTPTQFRKRFE